MFKPLIIATSTLLLLACGAEPTEERLTEEQPTGEAQPAPNNTPSTCSLCDLEASSFAENSQLVVISATTYQTKIATLLGLDNNEHFGNGNAISAFSGRALLREDNAQQRMNLAVESFYRNAQHIADQHTAIDCTEQTAQNCANAFIKDFVEPLFERPLNDEEQAYYHNLFNQPDGPLLQQQKTAMIAALSAPQFWLRMEATDEQ